MSENRSTIRRIAVIVVAAICMAVLLPVAALAAQPYIVQKGDTVYIISQKTGVSPSQIISRNGLVYPYEIFPGQELVIDGPDYPSNVDQNSNTPAYEPAPVPTAPQDAGGLSTGTSFLDSVLDWTKSYGWVVLFAVLKAFNLV